MISKTINTSERFSIFKDRKSHQVYSALISQGIGQADIVSGLWSPHGEIVLGDGLEGHQVLLDRVGDFTNQEFWYGFSFYGGPTDVLQDKEVVVLYGSSVGNSIPEYYLRLFQTTMRNLIPADYKIVSYQPVNDTFPQKESLFFDF